jgi:hypothetical protein
MPNARNNPNECCPCGYTYDSGQGMCVLSNTTACPAACPANMSGSPCACESGFVPDPSGAAGCVQEQYTLSEPKDQTKLPDVEPGSTAEITVRVTSVQTSQPKQGAVVRFYIDADITSGGHDHGEENGRRPRGTISSDNCVAESGGTPDTYDCTTGPLGYAGFTFNAPDVSGTQTITATCISAACSGSITSNIDVKVGGLEPIPDSPFYVFIGDTKEHKNNHFLTPAAATVLKDMAASYYIEDKFWQLKQARRGKNGQYTYTASKFQVNDASLKWGGKFDIHGGWIGDHKGHKRGIVVDIRANQININNGAIPLESFDNFQKMAKSYSAKAQIHCSNKTRLPPTCIVNGSEDINRHFHVILIGGIDK